MSDSGQKLVRLSQNGTNPGLFQIRFQYILLSESDLKSPGFVPFWTNLTPPKVEHILFKLKFQSVNR